jgi:L-fuculose-phosphate aldolase
MKFVDLSERKILSGRDIETARSAGATDIVVHKSVTLKASARELLQKLGIAVRFAGDVTDTASPAGRIGQLFNSPEATAIKQEICCVGRKLWERSYVDGNGGNISYRLGDNEIICTPTLLSKADLTPDALCLVDLHGNQLAGSLKRTSEVFMHLEIYKSAPSAKAVVHCHPPHATAYAITGQVPPPSVIPEFDIFIGGLAITPYETPGTKAFSETVKPYVQKHNSILLGNHGIVCWADTPTHAEWYVENVEMYCWTLLLSKHLGFPYFQIPPGKQQDLLAIKKRMGLPDPRFDREDTV